MTKQRNPPIHPGIYVKKNILPDGMTVKKVAEMMGIGRPALSNLLNGKAKLSPKMATRLAKTFNVRKTQLLMLQQEYEAFLNEENERKIAVRSYAPSFLNIQATHIDTWAEKIEARSLLPALLRRLVNSTGSEITRSDFPAYDNSQRKGWDGQVESENVTPWIPSGISGWEFGCNKNPEQKADDDYSLRTRNVLQTERENTTFIFVTPRNWSSKEDWIKAKKERNEWKDVRAYDANDLEQWLELSVPGQVWLAEKLGLAQEGCRTLDDYWVFWSGTASPAINKKIFDSAVKAHGNTIREWYQKPADNPLVITASSKEEALAFIACAADGIDELHPFAEQAVLVLSGDTMKRLAAITTEFIPIAYTDSAETGLVTSFKDRHAIIVVEKSPIGIEPDIVVDLPDYGNFRDALTEMGFDDAEREIHSNRSGKSPTILRRQLATIPAFKKPAWATTNERIRMMIPFVLAGAWKSDQGADQEILKKLANIDFEIIERNVAELVSINDAPIWSEGKFRGVVSKLDCFHAVSAQVTEKDLNNFFLVAEDVLSEDNPALDLDKDERWMANIHDEVREHSEAIRKSICETLIILTIHGDSLFGKRLSINIEGLVAGLVGKLLKGQSSRVWQSQQDDLPMYAEAAPNEFLGIVEFELMQENPAFASLFESIGEGIFSSCERTGMLWALELLAWDASRLSRVIKILAQLCTYKLEDNWAEKPINSLRDILLSWMPHTTAAIGQRCDVLELLCQEYPEVGWTICTSELKPEQGSTSGTYRPRWRSDASGAGQGVTPRERFDFLKKCQELVLSWPTYTQATLSDLIDCLSGMDNNGQELITNQIKIWLDSSPSAEDILKLRERVRIGTMTRRYANYANGKKIYDLLEPKEIILKHNWLFAKQWVEYTPEELEEDNLDYEAQKERLSRQRISALKEVLETYGPKGAIELCLKGEAGSSIGFHLARDIMNKEEIQGYVVKCLSIQNHSHRIDSCLFGILHQLDNDKRQTMLDNLTEQFVHDNESFNKIIRLFINAPFMRSTWNTLQTQNEKIQEEYWKTVYPYWNNQLSEDLNYALNQLMQTNRPRAAFDIARLRFDRVESDLLVRLLRDVAANTSESDRYPRNANYEIEQALKSLNNRHDLKRSELSRLEYLYIQALTPISEYGIPNLSRSIAESPLLFMQLLAMCSRRDDDGKDPEEWNLPTDPEHRQQSARNAYSALDHADAIPGSQKDGAIDKEQLRNWIIEVRNLAKDHGRKDIADEIIGQILSKSGIDADGIWPRQEVRMVLEEIASEKVSIGMKIGLRNSRGVQERLANGAPERELADKYRNFAERVINKTPFVGRMLSNIAQSYERDADWYDTDDRVQRRLHG